MTSRARYLPLSANDIRVVTILPSTSATSQLKLEIAHISLDEPCIEYAALSYTWKSMVEHDDLDLEDVYEQVLIDGHEKDIHKNLVDALRSIRTDHPQRVWADALCINQADAAERSSQVLMMGEIFSHATHVWAWLGCEAKSSDSAMEFLTRLARDADDPDFSNRFANEYLQPSYYPTWEALRSLMNRTWWRRAWVVQEFALAQEVTFLCGNKRLTLHDLQAADQALFVHFSTAKYKDVQVLRESVAFTARSLDPARKLLDLRQRLCRGERISALASLQMTRLSYASDPRDHLFAKLGLSGRDLADLCSPNYEISAEDVWFTFFSSYIKKRKDLYPICLAGMQPRTYHQLPTWLPDWGPSKPTYPLLSLTSDDATQWPLFDAAKGTEADVVIKNTVADGLLICHGFQTDTVDGVAGDQWAANPIPFRQSKSIANMYQSKTGSFNALCRTVTANTNRMGIWAPPPPEFNTIFSRRWHELGLAIARYELSSDTGQPRSLCAHASGFERAWRSMRNLNFAGEPLKVLVQNGLETILSALEPDEQELLQSTPASSHPLWTSLEHSAGQACLDRYVYTTDNGYLGLGPMTTQPGDKIVILFGCKLPVILRPYENHYTVVGETYVDGIMQGEAIAQLSHENSSLTIRTFEIR